MLKAWKAVFICFSVTIGLMIELIFCWCRPIKRLIRNLIMKGIAELGIMNYNLGNYETAEYLGQMVIKYSNKN